MWNKFDWTKWKVLLKLDPDKVLTKKALTTITTHLGIDGVVIGGTQNITHENTEQLVYQIREQGYRGPLIQELSRIDAVSLNVDGYFLPLVLNTSDTTWFMGKHLEGVKKYGEFIDWTKILPEAYLILNPHCAAAKLTNSVPPSLNDILAYVTLVEELFHLPIIYLEYSGTYGDPEIVQAVVNKRKKARVFYGGGISNEKQALEMAGLADAIIIGNIIYENPEMLDKILDSLS